MHHFCAPCYALADSNQENTTCPWLEGPVSLNLIAFAALTLVPAWLEEVLFSGPQSFPYFSLGSPLMFLPYTTALLQITHSGINPSSLFQHHTWHPSFCPAHTFSVALLQCKSQFKCTDCSYSWTTTKALFSLMKGIIGHH